MEKSRQRESVERERERMSSGLRIQMKFSVQLGGRERVFGHSGVRSMEKIRENQWRLLEFKEKFFIEFFFFGCEGSLFALPTNEAFFSFFHLSPQLDILLASPSISLPKFAFSAMGLLV